MDSDMPQEVVTAEQIERSRVCMYALGRALFALIEAGAAVPFCILASILHKESMASVLIAFARDAGTAFSVFTLLLANMNAYLDIASHVSVTDSASRFYGIIVPSVVMGVCCAVGLHSFAVMSFNMEPSLDSVRHVAVATCLVLTGAVSTYWLEITRIRTSRMADENER